MTAPDHATDTALPWADEDDLPLEATGLPLPPPRDDKAQRLYNLVASLRWSGRPLTLERLRELTGYYRQPDRAAARRQFERDKVDLLASGVPLDTVDGPDGPAYTIDRRTAALPPVDLLPDEVAALAMATRAARDGRARQAFEKLAARAPRPDARPDTGADVDVDDGPVDLLQAVRERRIVRFAYPGSEGVHTRIVYPHRLLQRRGAWYIRGHDRDRGAARTFRLDRVVGDVHVDVNPWAFPPATPVELAEGVVTPPAPDEVAAVVVALPSAHDALEALGARRAATPPGPDGAQRFTLHGVERRRLLAVLTGRADTMHVVDPPELRAAVATRLRAVLDGLDGLDETAT